MQDPTPDPRLVCALAAQRGHVNLLVTGASGAGKSTLINALFGAVVAEVGHGRPVTPGVREISADRLPVTVIDTRGLEVSRYGETADAIRAIVAARAAEPDPNRHVHVVWVCVAEESRRVQEAESRLVRQLSAHAPVLAVVTKARSDRGFRDVVRRLLPEVCDVVRVRALEEVDEEGARLAARGLAELVERTRALVPEGQRRAQAAAQALVLRAKREAALEAVRRYARLATGAGASPVPGMLPGLLVPLHLAMRDAIHEAFAAPEPLADGEYLGAIARYGPRTLDVAQATAGELLKAALVVGTASGGALSAHAARRLTQRCGAAYVAALTTLIRDPARRSELGRYFVLELRR